MTGNSEKTTPNGPNPRNNMIICIYTSVNVMQKSRARVFEEKDRIYTYIGFMPIVNLNLCVYAFRINFNIYNWANMHWPDPACFAWYRSRTAAQKHPPNTKRSNYGKTTKSRSLCKRRSALCTLLSTWQGAFPIFTYLLSYFVALCALVLDYMRVYRFTKSLNKLWIWIIVVTVFFRRFRMYICSCRRQCSFDRIIAHRTRCALWVST